MRRVLQTVSVVACLAVAVGAPRGLLLAAVAAGLGIARSVYAQQAAEPRFEVVSLKRNDSPEPGGRNALERGMYQGIGVSVRRIIALAYAPLPTSQIAGGPSWLFTDRFDVQAKFAGNPPREQVQQMMRTMLADRFKLRTHIESRPAPVFALVVARQGALGPSLRPSPIDCSDPAARSAAQAAQAAGAPVCAFQYTDGLLRGRGVTLDRIAGELVAGRVVTNRTGLTGTYDIELRWTPDTTQIVADDAPPTLATALREQLGLRLEPMSMPLDYLVIDSVERPSAD
jgi:uncharacterized protein (TIGR03435 family)